MRTAPPGAAAPRRVEGDWADSKALGGRLDVLGVTPMAGGQDLLVHWAPGGFNGWRAHCRFTMTDSHITLADLQYA